MIFLICGEYKTGKTVSACTFPKPLLLLDYDNGFLSVPITKDRTGKLVVPDHSEIIRVQFYKSEVQELNFKTDMGKGGGVAPKYTSVSMEMHKKYNTIVKELYEKKAYQEKKIRTLVIDSLTTMFRLWKEAILSVNNIPALRIADYGSLEGILYGQFIPTLRTLVEEKIVDNIVLITHIDMEKDDILGSIIEFPVGPSRNMGRNMGLYFDEIYRQKQEGDKYVWRTKKTGFFQAGSRLNVTDGIEAHYKSLAPILDGIK